MLPGLTLALCVSYDPFPFASGDPFEAIWRVATAAAVVLGVETVALASFGRGARVRRLAVVAGIACVLTAAMAVVAGRFAVRGLVCAGAPILTPLPPDVQAALNAQADQDTAAIQILGLLTILAWVAVPVLALLAVFGWPHRQSTSRDTGAGQAPERAPNA